MNTGQEKFELLFNTINDFLFIIDLQGNIVEINNAVLKALGYKREELLGKNITLIHPEESRASAAIVVQEMVDGKRDTCPIPLISKSGIYIPAETRVKFGKWDDKDVLIGISRDLSDIVLSEAKFRKVFEHNQAMMAISDINTGTFIDVNNKFLEKLGYTKEEILGNSSKNMNLFFDYHEREKLAQRLLKNITIDNEAVVIYTKHGEQRHAMFSATIIKIQTKEYLLTSALDITELVQTEEKLKRSLKHQTLLADISQQFITIDNLGEKIDNLLSILGEHTEVSRVYIFEDDAGGLTTNNTYEWCNWGITPQKEQLQHIPYTIIPSWKQLLKEKGRVFSTNINELPQDLINILAPQDIKSILVFPLQTPNGFHGFIGFDECNPNKDWEIEDIELLRTVSVILSNVFGLKEYQEELKESELRLSSAINNTETGLYDYNRKTGNIILNEMLCKMLGYEIDEINPHISSWYALVHPEDKEQTKSLLYEHLEGKTPVYSSTHRLRTKSGKWKWILDKGKAVEFDENHIPVRIIGTHNDIDSQKQIEEELRSLNATKDKLFSIIAHDLRGPIGTMMRLSEMVSEKGLLDQDTIDEILNSQKELSQSTYHLLENLLSWARLNMEQIRYSPRNIIINSIVDETILGIKYQAQTKFIEISIDIKEKVNAYADEDMVKLILRNLLSNAIKFTPENGTIIIRVNKREKDILIEVEDSGIGISTENIEKILSDNQFYSTYGTSNEKGNGLGLKLCKNFVIANKGTFSINSTIGKGTNFSFTLPLENVNEVDRD